MDEKRQKEIAEERLTSWAAYGDTPFNNAPNKGSCEVYKYPKTKPDSVFVEGKACKYRREK